MMAADAARELKALMLMEPRWMIAVAESLTAGNLQARVASVSGASNYFMGGIAAYSLDQKVKLLRVDRGHAVAVNCVSAKVAEQMATGVCGLFGADVGVATTGYAEAAPELGVAVPFAWWAVARRGERGGVDFRIQSGRVEVEGAERVEVQRRVAERVLEEVVRAVREWRK